MSGVPRGEREVNDEPETDDPRGAPQPDSKAGPLVVEKHRHREAGEEISFYACGPVRGSLVEAQADAESFRGAAAEHARAVKLAEDYLEQLALAGKEAWSIALREYVRRLKEGTDG